MACRTVDPRRLTYLCASCWRVCMPYLGMALALSCLQPRRSAARAAKRRRRPCIPFPPLPTAGGSTGRRTGACLWVPGSTASVGRCDAAKVGAVWKQGGSGGWLMVWLPAGCPGRCVRGQAAALLWKSTCKVCMHLSGCQLPSRTTKSAGTKKLPERTRYVKEK